MGAYGKYIKGFEPCIYCIRGNHQRCTKANNCSCGCPVRESVRRKIAKAFNLRVEVLPCE